jgi:hypothetical protein
MEGWLVLEGPGLGFKLVIVKVNGWELVEMGTRINEVFNRHWKRAMTVFLPGSASVHRGPLSPY